MANTDDLLEGLRKQYSLYGQITKTSNIDKVTSIDPGLTSKQLKPDPVFKIVMAVLLTFFWIMMIKTARTNPQAVSNGIAGGFVIVAGITGAFFYTLFLNKRLNFTITLSGSGIAINNELYNWSNIKETAILTVPRPRRNSYYLVLLLSDDHAVVRQLTNFRSSPHPFHTKLANYIDYFKM